MESIKVKLHEGGCMPERHGAFYDLATRQEERLAKGEVRIIPLGVSIKLPEGQWGMLVPRSSTCLKHGIMEANSVGVVEPDYCGDDDEWGFVAYAVRDTVIPAGTRICQFATMPLMPEIECEQVESTGKPNRGGYGSTGEKAAKADPKLLDADGYRFAPVKFS